MSDEQIELGEKVRDPITDFEGTVTARTEWLYGCVRLCVERGRDGKAEEAWFDEQRVERVGGAEQVEPAERKTGGGTDPAPRDPQR